MSHFILFFDEKEGTSPLVRLLDHVPGVSVLHQVGSRGWEPFDAHNCGPMPLSSLRACLDLVYGTRDMLRLDRIYRRTGMRALEDLDPEARAVGFKMRFHPPHPRTWHWRFARTMRSVLARHGVVAFVAVRQDLLRWSLSKYHGDGTGKPGHLQFGLARGRIRRDEIPRIEVDCARLGALIDEGRRAHARKRALVRSLERAGIRVHALLYEDFVADARACLSSVLAHLDAPASAAELDGVFARGAHFEKVHAHDISEFVVNHDEVTRRFGDAFAPW